MRPISIMVAPNGARRTRGDHPALPMTARELADAAARCLSAGAAMIHVHVRDDAGRHVLDAPRYRDTFAAIRDAVGDGLVLQATTEAVGRYAPRQQMALVRDLRPEAVSIALRELVPDAAAEPAAAAFLGWLAEEPIAPQFILYSPDEIGRFDDLRRRGVMPDRFRDLLFVLGRYAENQQSDPADLLPFVAANVERHSWTVCAFGRNELACAAAAMVLGGDVRVGFENNLHLRDGTPAPDNAALVAQAVRAAEAVGVACLDGPAARDRLRRPPS